MTSSSSAAWLVVAAGDAGSGEPTGTDLLVRVGLPLLHVLIGLGLWLWGRRERAEARAEIGVKGGFGGPPGTTDIGTQLGFGVEGPGPDPDAGGGRILAGLICLGVGALALVVGLIWTVAS
jgi:hypothetical protein